MRNNAIAINAMEISISDGVVPEFVPLIPSGQVTGRDGRKWLNSHPEVILEAFVNLGRDLPVDVEHSSELKAPNGDPAPAVGWGKELLSRNGEIWARVDWTVKGKALLADKSYRYLSPVITYNKDSGIIVGVTSVGLTNQPNLRLPALNREQWEKPTKEETMNLIALLAALGLPETATEEQALAKITGLQTDLATATNRVNNPSLEKFVPRADYDAALGRATNAEQQLAQILQLQLETAVNAAIDQALKDGKITPATVDYHRAQCRQNGGLDRFTAYCAAAPVLGELSGLERRQAGDAGATTLNDTEKKVCAAMGISEADYLKAAC